jgi:hypothetical protein
MNHNVSQTWPTSRKNVVCDYDFQLDFSHKRHLRLKINLVTNNKSSTTLVAIDKWNILLYNMSMTILYMYSRMSSCDYACNYICNYIAHQQFVHTW